MWVLPQEGKTQEENSPHPKQKHFGDLSRGKPPRPHSQKKKKKKKNRPRTINIYLVGIKKKRNATRVQKKKRDNPFQPLPQTIVEGGTRKGSDHARVYIHSETHRAEKNPLEKEGEQISLTGGSPSGRIRKRNALFTQ